jgi:hypothetical protein
MDLNTVMYIKIKFNDGNTIVESKIKAPNVTPAMFDACRDLDFTMMTGVRRTTHEYVKEAKRNAKAAAKTPKKAKK